MDRYLKNITKYHRVFFLENYKIEDNKITFEAKYPPEISHIFDDGQEVFHYPIF